MTMEDLVNEIKDAKRKVGFIIEYTGPDTYVPPQVHYYLKKAHKALSDALDSKEVSKKQDRYHWTDGQGT